MKGETKAGGSQVCGAPLSCFLSRGQVNLMRKPVYSPSRPGDPIKGVHSRPVNRCHGTHLFPSTFAADEPSSPTVTCAGQVKVAPGPTSQSHRQYSEIEMETLHKQKMKKKNQCFTQWLQFRIRCFGPVHGTVDCSADEEEDSKVMNEEEEEVKDSASTTMFSKGFVVLEEREKVILVEEAKEEGSDAEMVDLEEEGLFLMSYVSDFYKVSTEIVKETWIVGD